MNAWLRCTSPLLVAAALAACRDAPDETVRVDATPAGRAAEARLPMQIEGMTDTIAARLVWSPVDAEPRFSTYVPEDMVPDFGDVVEGAYSFSVNAAFGGTVSEHAFMAVHFYPPGTPLDEAQMQLAAFMASLEPYDDPVHREDDYGVSASDPDAPELARQRRFGWAQPEIRFHVQRGEIDRTVAGWAALGQHGGRAFHVFVHYPEEYAEGMGARVQLMLEQWRWLDDGSRLGDSPPPPAPVPDTVPGG
jgi:hypothetical protein